MIEHDGRTEVEGCIFFLFTILCIGLISTFIYVSQHESTGGSLREVTGPCTEHAPLKKEMDGLIYLVVPTPVPTPSNTPLYTNTPINTPTGTHCNRFTIKLAGIWQVAAYESSIDSTTDSPITTIEFVPTEE